MAVSIVHVGLGGWGGNWARNVIPVVPGVEVAAVVDPVEATRTTVLAQTGLSPDLAFGTLTEALAAVDADAVVLTSPARTHVPLALEALEAGRHVLVEKPFANTAAEAVVAARRADDLGLVLQVSQNYRNFPAPIEARRILQSGVLGELSAISIDFRQWDNDPAVGTYPHYLFPHPLINDMAIHHFDLLRMITGAEALSVFAKVGDPSFSKYQDEASAAITIGLETGLVVSYRGSWLSRGPRTPWAGEWSIQGEHGELRFGSRADEPEDTTGDYVTLRLVGESEHADIVLEHPQLSDRTASLHLFSRAVAGEITPETSGVDNLGSLAMMEAAARSAASGREERVEIPTLATKEQA